MTTTKVEMTLSEKAKRNASRLQAVYEMASKRDAVENSLSATAFLTNEMLKGNKVFIASPDGKMRQVFFGNLMASEATKA